LNSLKVESLKSAINSHDFRLGKISLFIDKLQINFHSFSEKKLSSDLGNQGDETKIIAKADLLTSSG
jgi:hypothetical protein